MTNNDTRIAMDTLYKNIESAKKAIQNIRDKCSHDKSSEQNYSWRPGAMNKVQKCDYCDEITDSPFSQENLEVTTTTFTTNDDDGEIITINIPPEE